MTLGTFVLFYSHPKLFVSCILFYNSIHCHCIAEIVIVQDCAIKMRRSLGTKPGVLPPKRVRASQENAQSVNMAPAPRQSRASTAGMSSGKRVSSVSRSVHSCLDSVLKLKSQFRSGCRFPPSPLRPLPVRRGQAAQAAPS